MITGPFSPGRSYTLLVGDASTSIPIDPDASSLRLVNPSPGLVVFIRVGVGAQVAQVGDMAVGPGSSVTITKGVGANTLAAISSDTTGTETTSLFATTGEGL